VNNRPTVKDVYGLLGGIETDIDWLTSTVKDLKADLKEHIKNDLQVWMWAIPTVLMLVNFAVTLFWKR